MKQSRPRRYRRLALIAVPAAAALLLAGCSGSGSGTVGTGPEPQSITFAFGSPGPGEHFYQDVATAFEAAHKGVTVKTELLPAENYATAITTRVQAGSAPDLFIAESGTGASDSVIPLAKAGLLLKLGGGVAAKLPKGEEKDYQYQDKTYGVAVGTSVNGIIWNPAVAKKLGLNITADSNLDDVIAACPAAAAKGVALFGLAGSVSANPGIAAMELAASVVYGPNPDWNKQRAAGDVKFATSQGWKTTLAYLKKMYDARCFQPGAAGAGFDALTAGSSTGKIIGFFSPSFAAKSIMDATGGKVTLTVLPFPAPQGVNTLLSVSSNTGLVASAKTKSPKLVSEFIDYVTSAEGAKTLADGQGTIPVNATDASSFLPQYAPVADKVTGGDTRPLGNTNWPNPQIYDDLGSGVTAVMTGQKTADEVLKQLDADWG